MTVWTRLQQRCLFFRNRSRFDSEMDEEMQIHLQMKVEENLAAGMPAAEADAAARRGFGNTLRLREESREQWGWGWLERLGQDVRFGWRIWRRSPALTAAIVLSLALGIGANTAIFTIFDGLLLRPLPVPKPNQLVLLQWRAPKFFMGWLMGNSWQSDGSMQSTSFSYLAFEDFRQRAAGLCHLFAFADAGLLQVQSGGHTAMVNGEVVSANMLATLGVSARLGRLLESGDDRPGSTPVVMLSSAFWEKYLGSDPSIVGRQVVINGHPFTVAGILPARFTGVEPGVAQDVYLPLSAAGAVMFHELNTSNPDAWWLQVMGRREPGADPARLRAALALALRQAAQETKLQAGIQFPRDMPHLQILPGARGVTETGREIQTPLFILMAVVSLVLLIACVNIASLLLSRSSARQQEMAVRLSLGAGRARLLRQLLTESLLLAVAGAAAGFLLAQWACRAVLAAMPQDQPLALSLRPDLHILLFTTGLVILSGLLFGLTPAWQATRVSVTATLKCAAPTLTGPGRRWSVGRAMVGLQVALSLVLLAGAGLFLRTLRNLQHTDLGLNPRNLLVFQISPGLSGYSKPQIVQLNRELQARIAGLPGVQNVSWSQFIPLSGNGWITNIRIPGRILPKSKRSVYATDVSPGFFATLQIPLLQGRDFVAGDASTITVLPAIVNRAMVQRYFPSRQPIGARFTWGGEDGRKTTLQIIGMVGDAKYNDLRKAAPATVYVPFERTPLDIRGAAFEVRTAGAPLMLVAPIRNLLQKLAPGVSLMDVKTEREQIAQRLLPESLFARTSAAFSALILLLLATGLYGVLAFRVNARTKEIGIRMALGAERKRVLRMVLRDAATLIAAGLLLGLPLAWLASRLIRTQLYGLKPGDPLTFIAACLVLLAVAFAAAWGPARRAARVDPLVALRYE